ncbi:MAG TPA: hypothetical protein VK901_16385 [Nitrospiraceae bacterium]|nr:hypothetical protein [Nitrospiraceae bacterium]
MSKVYPAMAVLVLALVSLVGYESRAGGEANPIRVAEMQKAFRDLWLGHIFMIQHVVLFNRSNNPAERDIADKQVLVNAKQIANTFTPFYGEARSEKLFTLLSGHYAAVKEYSEATIAANTRQQYTALTHMASSADDIDAFFNGVNPHYLPKDTIGGLIATHGAHHVLQINQYKKKEYAKLEETWLMMRQHVYVIADTLATALAKQFPDKFF